MNARVPPTVFQPERALSEVKQAWDQRILPELHD